jgi:hypothetical protein
MVLQREKRFAKGRQEGADRILREAVGKMRWVLEEDNPDTVATLHSLGWVPAIRGDRRSVLDRLVQAVTHSCPSADEMPQDAHPKRLASDPAFAAIVARARKKPDQRRQGTDLVPMTFGEPTSGLDPIPRFHLDAQGVTSYLDSKFAVVASPTVSNSSRRVAAS